MSAFAHIKAELTLSVAGMEYKVFDVVSGGGGQ